MIFRSFFMSSPDGCGLNEWPRILFRDCGKTKADELHDLLSKRARRRYRLISARQGDAVRVKSVQIRTLEESEVTQSDCLFCAASRGEFGFSHWIESLAQTLHNVIQTVSGHRGGRSR